MDAFIPVFIDTLKDLKTTKRFGEKYGSYPVLRVHDHGQNDIAGRVDGNPVAGRIPLNDVLALMQRGRERFEQSTKRETPK